MILLALAALAAEPVDFSPTLPSGGKWKITEEVSTSMPWEGGQLGSRTVTVTHLDVRQGGTIGRDAISFDGEIVAMRHEELRGADTLVWDSAEGKKPTEDQALYAALVGDKHSATLQADGTATATYDSKPLEKRLAKHGLDAELVQLVVGMITAEARALEAKQRLWQLPRGKLAIGQSWTSTVEDRSGVPLDWSWTLRGVEAGIATFDIGVSLPPMPMMEDMKCSGVASTEVTGAPRSVAIDCNGTNAAVQAKQTIRTAVRWEARK